MTRPAYTHVLPRLALAFAFKQKVPDFEGRHDWNANSEIAAAWFNKLPTLRAHAFNHIWDGYEFATPYLLPDGVGTDLNRVSKLTVS